MAANKHNKVFRAIQLVKILCSSFFVCLNCHSDRKSLNVYHVADFMILCFLLLFNSLFIDFFGVVSVLKSVEKVCKKNT